MSRNKLLLYGYGMCVLIYALLQTQIMSHPTLGYILKLLFGGCLVIEMLLSAYAWKTIKIKILAILSVLMIAIIYNIVFHNAQESLLFIVFFMVVLSRCDEKDILKQFSTGVFLAIVITLLLTRIGVLKNTVGNDGRETLGFLFTTFGANMFLHAAIAYIAYKKDSVKLQHWIALELVNIFFYSKTQTIAVFLMVNVLCILFYCGKIRVFSNMILNNRIIKFLLSHSATIIALLTIGFQLFYNKYYTMFPILRQINNLVSFRLTYGLRAFQDYRITLFGNSVVWNMETQGYFYLDSSYLNILFSYGIFMLIVVCYLINFIAKYALRFKDYYLLIALLVLLGHSISDPQLLSFRYNPFFIIIIVIMYKMGMDNRFDGKLQISKNREND